MRLGAIDPDGDLCAGGAQLLEEPAVGPDPQILLGYLHLRVRVNITHYFTETADRPALQ